MIKSIKDLENISEIVRINTLLKSAGIPAQRIRMRQARGKHYLMVEEAEAINEALAKYGLHYKK